MPRSSLLVDAVQDIRQSVHHLRRRFGFATAAIVPLALGIGAATAMYSVVDGVLLRPLPFPEPDRIVTIWATEESWKGTLGGSTNWDRVVIGQGEFAALRDQSTSFSEVGAWGRTGGMLANRSGGFAQVPGLRVTTGVFSILGVRPVLGRVFEPGVDALNGPAVAMLGWETWQRQFGGDSSIVGKSVVFDEQSLTVVGIMPAGFRIDRSAAAPGIILPAFQQSYDAPTLHNRSYRGMARLKPGVTVNLASQEVARIMTAVKVEWKGSALGTSGRAVNYQDDQTASIRPSLIILTASVALLMLIACVNLAMLLFGEMSRRQPEIAARTALGASPGRLARQLLVESLVIAGSAAILGAFLGWAMTRSLIALAPGSIPGIADVHFDLRVLLFTVLCAVACGASSAVLPVLALLRLMRLSVFGSASRQTMRGEVQVQRVLVAVEVALSVLLLVGCSLLGRSLIRLADVDPGFSPSGLLLVELTAPASLWADSSSVVNFVTAAVPELKAIPGVTAVSGTNSGLFNGRSSNSPIRVVGAPETEEVRRVDQRVVLPGYFRTLGVPITSGRDFTAEDNASSTRVAIISRAEADRDFPGVNPLGAQVVWQGAQWTVIGVAADVHYTGLDSDFQPAIYLPDAQWAGNWMSFLIRASGGDGSNLSQVVRERLGRLNPSVVFSGINPVPSLIQRSYGEERYRALLGSLFGVLGTVLAACGMFGVISRTVTRRLREAGIRAALGAQPRSLTRLMLQESLIGVTIGAVVGIVAATLLARSLTPYLFGIDSMDPVAYLTALLLLGLATALSTVPAARRAGRVDPVRVLGAE